MKELTIEITNKCGNNCIHCSTQAVYDNHAIFLPKKKVNEALDRFPDFDRVRFSGGEPFMHPRVIDFLKEAKRRGKFVSVLTSGSMGYGPIPKHLIKKCKGLADNIAFSIYGGEHIHLMVAREPSFHCLDKSIDEVIANKIPFSFNFVAHKKSIGGLDFVIEYVGKRASEAKYCTPKLALLRFIKQGDGKERDDLSFDKKQIRKIMDYSQALAGKYGTELYFGCSLIERGCTAGIGKAVLTAHGDYIACSALKYGAKAGQFSCKDRW